MDEVKPGETTIFGSIPPQIYVKARFKGFIGEIVLFYPVWYKMAPNVS
jgi:hypothetical protein